MMARKVLFFLRHYNDLDHITPVVTRLAERGSMAADVVVGPELAADDYRLVHLNTLENVSVTFLTDYLLTEEKKRWQSALIKHRLFRRFVPIRSAEKYKDRHWFSIFAAVFGEDVVHRLMTTVFNGTDGGVVAFDWIHKGMNDYVGFAQLVGRVCRLRGIPMIALPHGDSPHCSAMMRLDELNYETADIYDTVSMFDAVVVPNTLCGTRYEAHARHIETMGSPRFNRQWLKRLTPLVTPFTMGDSDRLNVVFFLRNVGYPLYWDEVCRTIRMVRGLGAQVVVKHHTRDWKFDRLAKQYPELAEQQRPGLLVTCDPAVHSHALINWSDAVLDVGTSMSFEAIMQGKPVFSMEYLHPSMATVSRYFPSAVSMCRDHLYEGLRDLTRNGEGYYPSNELATFVSEIVEVGGPNVLDRYVDFLEEYAR